jgi:glutaredoxin
MKFNSLFTLILTLASLLSAESLPEKYLIPYGNPTAETKIVEYFSFICPHCISLFRKDFRKIRETYIDNGKIYWEFHPVPLDLVTVQSLVCLGDLSEREKRIFLEALLDEIESDDTNLTSLMMIKAMELFQKPKPRLRDDEFLENHPAFTDAFNFVKENRIEAVPTVEVNGKKYPTDVPDLSFVKGVLEKNKEEHVKG